MGAESSNEYLDLEDECSTAAREQIPDTNTGIPVFVL